MDHEIGSKPTEADADATEAPVLKLNLRDKKKVRALGEAARRAEDLLGETGRRGPDSTRRVVSRYGFPVPLADGSALLFNTRTRSLVLLDPTEATTYAALAEEGGFTGDRVADRVFTRTLVDGGHIVGANDDERAWVRQTYESARAPSNALSLTIAPTMACNFACGYCYQGVSKATTRMSAEVQDALVDFVKKREGLKSLNVVWYGGEPLMGRETLLDLSDRLITHCDKKGVSYSAGMVSNAHLLTPDVVRKLHTRRIGWVQVTLDGDRESHDAMRPLLSGEGTYDTILRNLEFAIDETTIAFNLRVNVGRRNVGRVDRMLDELAGLNLSSRGRLNVYFAKIEASTEESGEAADHLMPSEDFSAALLKLEDKARRLKLAGPVEPPSGFSGMCVAAISGGYVVASNGDLHKCWETMHDPKMRVGSLLSVDTVDATLNGAMWKSWTPFEDPVCADCRMLPMCGGHCAQRFVYWSPDQSNIPCPNWKWNAAEYIFRRALALGVVKPELWLESEATSLTKRSGAFHNRETLERAHLALSAKVERERIPDSIGRSVGEPSETA